MSNRILNLNILQTKKYRDVNKTTMFSNFDSGSSLILYSQIKTPFYKEKETASLLLHTLTQESILKKKQRIQIENLRRIRILYRSISGKARYVKIKFSFFL